MDIRDTVDYKGIMKEYRLGPNGGILTALNLFTTKFDQVLDLLQGRAQEETDAPAPVIIDTPGQIEIFTWSASGAIISEALGSHFPTAVIYVMDTERCSKPATFMSNMLYACSIMYKTRLPFVLVFNKTDLEPCDRALSWMQDFVCFQEALAGDETYMSSLVHSMSLVLEEFYSQLRVVGVSSVTGEGFPAFIEAWRAAGQEYEAEYRTDLEQRARERAGLEQQVEARSQTTAAERTANLEALMRDLALEGQADRREEP